MVLQIFFDHLYGYLTHSAAEIAPSPKASAPIAILDMGKLFK